MLPAKMMRSVVIRFKTFNEAKILLFAGADSSKRGTMISSASALVY
jgi:hypothetical protein